MGSDPIFVADAHLGGLARFLRMLGFDTLYRNSFSDAEIRRLAEDERRIVLTRDRELLKCREIACGCYVRSLKPEAQLREVAHLVSVKAFRCRVSKPSMRRKRAGRPSAHLPEKWGRTLFLPGNGEGPLPRRLRARSVALSRAHR